MYEEAFIRGFLKKAADYGLEKEALGLLDKNVNAARTRLSGGGNLGNLTSGGRTNLSGGLYQPSASAMTPKFTPKVVGPSTRQMNKSYDTRTGEHTWTDNKGGSISGGLSNPNRDRSAVGRGMINGRPTEEVLNFSRPKDEYGQSIGSKIRDSTALATSMFPNPSDLAGVGRTNLGKNRSAYYDNLGKDQMYARQEPKPVLNDMQQAGRNDFVRSNNTNDTVDVSQMRQGFDSVQNLLPTLSGLFGRGQKRPIQQNIGQVG